MCTPRTHVQARSVFQRRYAAWMHNSSGRVRHVVLLYNSVQHYLQEKEACGVKYELKWDQSELMKGSGVVTAGAAPMLHIKHHTSKLTTQHPQIERKRRRAAHYSAIDTRTKALCC
jgi:hypothetical protein